MASATAMYHSGKNPLRRVTHTSEDVPVARGLRQRRLHKAFLRYHDPNNWPVLREALRRMGKARLIGNGPNHLVPAYQPAGTGGQGEGQRRPTPGGKAGQKIEARRSAATARPPHPMRTQHTGLPRVPARLPGKPASRPAGKPRKQP
jgi:hypothetical protein